MLGMTTTGAMYQKSELWVRLAHYITLVSTVFLLVSAYPAVDAATTYNRNSQPEGSVSHIGGRTSIGRMVEPAFANAGKVAGLEIWRIEDFKPVPYPKKDYGKFYTGDSYIVLHTKEQRNGIFNWDLHFWLGTETSQDEAGAAAILSVTLDDQLGGDPVQYREVQEYESQLFLSNFKSGIRYIPGGVSSGFSHVDPNAFETKLFQVKGKRNIRVKQVPLAISSMNKGDCFILDAGNKIYVYVGVQSKKTERLKAIYAANLIRDQDHGGRSKIDVLDEFSSPTEVQEFFDVLGHGSPSAVPDEETGGDDEHFEISQERTVTLYRVSDSSGRMQVQQVGQKPLRQSQLDANDCFILETGDANLFVWIGKKCNKKEKDESMVKAQDFLKSKNYPTWTHVERVVQDAEPSTFRQYFQSWQATGELHPRAIRSAAAKPTVLAEKSGGELPEFMPDDGSGQVEIYRVENFELVPVPVENYGKFFGGDSYVIKYRSTRGKWFIYYWQGDKSSIDEKAASAMQAVRMDNELGGKAIQIRVVQDYEPKHFLHMFKGKLITFLGGHASGFKNIKEHDTYVEGETRLYRVRGTNEIDVRASQQLPSAKSLASDDVFIVENGAHTWLWFGKGADDVEKELGHVFVKLLVPNSSPVVIQEGEESVDFWDALGGRTPYAKNFKSNLQTVTEAKLYHCHVSDNGHVRVEEIQDLDQNDLDEDDVMLIDSTEEIFVWVGKGATEHEIKHVFSKLHQLLRRYQREHAVVVTVKQGEEPDLFTMLFPTWNSNIRTSGSAYNDMKQKLSESNKAMA